MGRPTLAFSGYTVGELLHDGRKSVVYRARRDSDGAALVLKVLRGAPPAADEVAGFRRQHEIVSELDLPGVVASRGYEQIDGRPVLLLEDFGGISLARLLAGRPLALDRFLEIALALAETLAAIHERGVLHRDINPSNIVIHPETHEVKITDFGLALRPGEAASQATAGTLLYIAPEQTGRLNRRVDQRSDLYSLGATFYKLLTGAPPFQATDRIELIHRHIARIPAPPHLSNRAVPAVLSAMVLKLLAKSAEDRYQTARGLAADLSTLRARRSSGEEPLDFPLGQRDISSELRLPQKLYGRDSERLALGSALERVQRGSRELLLVVGPAGVGKSALVREVFQPLAHHEGHFVQGKFGQYQKAVPYCALTDALGQLVERVLALPAAELTRQRQRLQAALGSNARLLCWAVPQLELVIGPPPALAELPAAEARNRFHLTFLRFVDAFASAGQPLVLFLDDLQWADMGSLELISLLLSAPDLSHLLLVCACRGPVPPQVAQLASDDADDRDRAAQRLDLAALKQPDVRDLLSDTLHCDAARSQGLAELVHRKTAGNPLFVTQFVQSLAEERLLAFDRDSTSWRWDLARIARQATTDNVVELMVRKIHRLPQQQQSLLTNAACLGTTFDLATLSLVSDHSSQQVEALLSSLMREGLVLQDDSANLLDRPASSTPRFRFQHDRVHQAAYSLLPRQQRAERHLAIGRLLVAERAETRVFEVVHQLNEATALITDSAERCQLAQLNLAAGSQARASSAHTDALGYLEASIALLEPSCWSTQYDLAFAAHLACAESAFFAGQRERAEQLFSLLRDHTKSLLQRAEVDICRLMLHDTAGEYQANREIGLEALEALGCDALAGTLDEQSVTTALQRFFELLQGREIGQLAELPQMSDPRREATMAVLVAMSAPAFISDQTLFASIVLEMVNTSIEHGNCEVSAFGYGALGVVFNALLDQPEQAAQLGELALALQRRFDYLPLQTKVTVIIGCFILPWTRPLDESLAMLRQAQLSGIEHGDLVYAAYASTVRLRYLYAAGRPLHEIDAEAAAFDHFLVRIPGDYLAVANAMNTHLRLAWAGRTRDPTRLGSDSYDEQAHVERMQREDLNLDLCVYWSYRVQLALANGQFEQADALARRYEPLLVHQAAMFDQLPFWMARALACSRLANVPDSPRREQLLADLAGCVARVQSWADRAPDNFTGHLLVLRSETARLAGKQWEALRLLGEADAWARAHESLWLQGLSNEMAGRSLLAQELPLAARGHLLAARQAYASWGGLAMVDRIDREFPQLLSLVGPAGESAGSTSTGSTSSEQHASSLDLLSVLKASQVIARELVLEQLLARLLDIAVENAGAETGVLVLELGGELSVEACRNAQGTSTARQALEQSDQVCAAVVHYVHRRQQSLVLDDAGSDARFCNDPYLQTHVVKSVLCAPLVAQGKLSGILYLENNQQRAAFTAQRLDVLRLLSTQMASALQNARLYRGIEAEVIQRTDELRRKNEQLQQTLTELQSAQAQLLQSKKMADLGRLAAGVSHEVNSPLGVLTSAADVIGRSAAQVKKRLARTQATDADVGAEDRQLRRALDALATCGPDIDRAVQRIAAITGGLARFAGLDQVELRRADVREGIRSTLELMTPQLGERIEIISQLEQVPEIVCYPSELNQVWMNLLENAGEAIDGPGQIWVRTRPGSDQLQVEIEDSGRGMPPELLDSLFDFHFSGRDRVHLGLGLKVSYNIVHKHGGTLSATNTGQGTRVTVSLPLAGLPAPE